jgi:hypothetical protein
MIRKSLFIFSLIAALIIWPNDLKAGIDSCTVAIDSTSFSSVLNTTANQDFDAEKITVISNSFKTKCFSCEQVKELLLLFSFEEDKVLIAKKAFSNVVDPQNFNLIYTVFEFDSSKTEIKQHIDGLLKTN